MKEDKTNQKGKKNDIAKGIHISEQSNPICFQIEKTEKMQAKEIIKSKHLATSLEASYMYKAKQKKLKKKQPKHQK